MTLRRHLLNVAIASVLVYTPMLVVFGACIAGRNGWNIAGIEIYLVVPVIAACVAALAFPFLFTPRTSQAAVAVLLVGWGVALSFFPALFIADRLRIYGFTLAARRAQPLVEAITRYTADTGTPPTTFEVLIPRYLDRLPTRIPQLDLVTGARARNEFKGNEWALIADVPTGLINWDAFLYLPNQQYPETGWGGGLERVDNWAYVHE